MPLPGLDHYLTTEPDVAGTEPDQVDHPFIPDAWKPSICAAKVAGHNGRTETCNRPAAEHDEPELLADEGRPDGEDHELNRGDYLRAAEQDR
jgi:hypothetical protein